MTHRTFRTLVGLCLLGVPYAMAAGRPVLNLPVPGSTDTPGQQLQNAVNDLANAGVRIHLSRGSYVLDASKPNGGRLFLQPGMEITGENAYVDCDHDGVWDALAYCRGSVFAADQFTVGDTETVIDGTGINAPATGNPAVVRAGNGNVLSHVTVLAPRRNTVAGSVDINLPSPTGRLNAVVNDNILMGGQRGIRANNGAPALSGISSSALIARNIVRDIQPVTGLPFSFGIQIQDNAATGSSWKAVLLNNRVYGCRFGYFIVANGSRMASIDVLSAGNIVRQNEIGMFIGAGFAPGGGPAGDASSDGNFRFTSTGDRIEDNITPVEHLDSYMNAGGGVVAFASARDSAVAGASSRNTTRLQFLNTTFLGNQRVDSPRHMMLFGSFSSGIVGTDAGTDNVLTLLMLATQSDDADGAYLLEDSAPDDATGTNRARVLFSDVDFDRP